MMKTKIETIWEALENDINFKGGILLRRYALEVKPDLYVAIKNAEKMRSIVFKVSQSFDNQSIDLANLKEIKIEIVSDEIDKSKKLLFFILLTPLHADIFAVLCEDLINNVKNVENEVTLLKTLKRRFLKWQSLFEKLYEAGLNINQQKGLFGELIFLKILVENSQNIDYILDSWLGMLKAPQDFYYKNKWALEIKTTKNNAQKLSISNELQLDESFFEHLFLLHISLETSDKIGKNLNQLIDELFNLLKNNTSATYKFKQKILDAGYYDLHKKFYEDVFYQVENLHYYQINSTSPRLTARNMPNGISETKYSISLLSLQKSLISQDNVLKTIKNHE